MHSSRGSSKFTYQRCFFRGYEDKGEYLYMGICRDTGGLSDRASGTKDQ